MGRPILVMVMTIGFRQGGAAKGGSVGGISDGRGAAMAVDGPRGVNSLTFLSCEY